MFHFSHGVGQLGEDISLQVQFCNVFQDTNKSRVGLILLTSVRRTARDINKKYLKLNSQVEKLRGKFISTTSELSESCKELARDGLHHVVGQCDNTDVF